MRTLLLAGALGLSAVTTGVAHAAEARLSCSTFGGHVPGLGMDGAAAAAYCTASGGEPPTVFSWAIYLEILHSSSEDSGFTTSGLGWDCSQLPGAGAGAGYCGRLDMGFDCNDPVDRSIIADKP